MQKYIFVLFAAFLFVILRKDNNVYHVKEIYQTIGRYKLDLAKDYYELALQSVNFDKNLTIQYCALSNFASVNECLQTAQLYNRHKYHNDYLDALYQAAIISSRIAYAYDSLAYLEPHMENEHLANKEFYEKSYSIMALRYVFYKF